MINWALLYTEIPNLAQGAGVTILVTIFSLCIGMVIGLAVAMLRLSKHFYLRIPATAYVEIFRCTPMLVQILLIYFGIVPELQRLVDKYSVIQDMVTAMGFPRLDFVKLPAIYTGIVALGLNSGAYLGEIFRGGILSIDKGQREAALSLGMKESQAMAYVVLPQALTNSLPAMGNEFITLIKDSSLLSSIAVVELLYRAMQSGSNNFEFFTMYIGAGLSYFVMCFTLSRFLAYYEKKRRVGYH